jgi:TLC domain
VPANSTYNTCVVRIAREGLHLIAADPPRPSNMDKVVEEYVLPIPPCCSAHADSRPLLLSREGIFPPMPVALTDAISPYCEALGFHSLAPHLHVILASGLVYQIMFMLSPYVSQIFTSYNNLRPRSKINWDIHVVSLFQSLLISYLAFLALGDPQLVADPVFGYSRYGADLSAMACGYFLWDTYVSVKYVNLFGAGFAAHGILSLFVFILGFVCPLNPAIERN